jgi:hypothetical protein
MLQTETRKDFGQREREIRESFDPMLRIQEVRKIIGCSYNFVIQLIQNGKLDAFDITGRVLDRGEVDEHSYGLRITPSSLQKYLNSNKVR